MGTFGTFAELDVAREDRSIRLNVLALMRLSHAALDSMLKRRSGAIVNLSSLAAYQPDPWSATYGATKAWVLSFSHALHEETRGTGVHVMAVCPGYTHTEFHDRAGLGDTALPEFLWQTPDQVVAAALRDLERGRALSIPARSTRCCARSPASRPPASAAESPASSSAAPARPPEPPRNLRQLTGYRPGS